MTTPEIAPRIDDDGEPRCWTGCPSFAGPEGRDLDCRTCQVGASCIPALRRQRDEALARAEKAEAEAERLQSERDALAARWESLVAEDGSVNVKVTIDLDAETIVHLVGTGKIKAPQ